MEFYPRCLNDRRLTHTELAAIIDALPQIIRESIIFLNVHENQLTALPDTIEQLTALQSLVVDGNQLTALPETISNIRTLREILIDHGVHIPSLRTEVQVWHV